MESEIYELVRLDDIVFEGRNKAYGAYQLRQAYYSHLFKASFLATALVFLLLGLSYVALILKPGLADTIMPDLAGKVVELHEELIFEQVAPVKPSTEIPTATPTQAFTSPKVVLDEVPLTPNVPSQAAFEEAEPELQTLAGEAAEGTALAEAVTSENREKTIVTQPFVFVEKMPEFPEGGQAGMYKFISKHLRYPAVAQSRGLEGNVIVSFVINAAGEITNIKILQDIGGGTAEEAIRVIASMPKWKPGIQNQQSVPVRMTLPIRFKLN